MPVVDVATKDAPCRAVHKIEVGVVRTTVPGRIPARALTTWAGDHWCGLLDSSSAVVVPVPMPRADQAPDEGLLRRIAITGSLGRAYGHDTHVRVYGVLEGALGTPDCAMGFHTGAEELPVRYIAVYSTLLLCMCP